MRKNLKKYVVSKLQFVEAKFIKLHNFMKLFYPTKIVLFNGYRSKTQSTYYLYEHLVLIKLLIFSLEYIF